jgi:hypothetical protein
LGVGSSGGVEEEERGEASGRAAALGSSSPSSPTDTRQEEKLPRSHRLQRGRDNADLFLPWSVCLKRGKEKREVGDLVLSRPKFKFEFEFSNYA